MQVPIRVGARNCNYARSLRLSTQPLFRSIRISGRRAFPPLWTARLNKASVDYRHRRFRDAGRCDVRIVLFRECPRREPGSPAASLLGWRAGGRSVAVPGAQACWEHNRAGSERDEIHRSNCRWLAMGLSAEPFCANQHRRLCRQEPCTFLMAT